MPKPEWIEHRRGDGELVGWMAQEGDGFVPIDLLGRALSERLDWFEAERLLNETGIGYLAEAYELRLDDGHWLRVRILEVSTDRILVKKEDWGDMGAPQLNYTVAWPIPDTLRALDRSR
jgi:hypothetical protein